MKAQMQTATEAHLYSESSHSAELTYIDSMPFVVGKSAHLFDFRVCSGPIFNAHVWQCERFTRSINIQE